MRKFFFKDSFFDTIEEIYSFIKKESPQNANKFKSEVRKQIEKIQKTPNLYPVIDLEDFENPENKYHYSHFYKTFKMIYKIEFDSIVFLGVIHDKRDTKAMRSFKS